LDELELLETEINLARPPILNLMNVNPPQGQFDGQGAAAQAQAVPPAVVGAPVVPAAAQGPVLPVQQPLAAQVAANAQMFFPAVNMLSEERMLCPAPSGEAILAANSLLLNSHLWEDNQQTNDAKNVGAYVMRMYYFALQMGKCVCHAGSLDTLLKCADSLEFNRLDGGLGRKDRLDVPATHIQCLSMNHVSILFLRQKGALCSHW